MPRIFAPRMNLLDAPPPRWRDKRFQDQSSPLASANPRGVLFESKDSLPHRLAEMPGWIDRFPKVAAIFRQHCRHPHCRTSATEHLTEVFWRPDWTPDLRLHYPEGKPCRYIPGTARNDSPWFRQQRPMKPKQPRRPAAGPTSARSGAPLAPILRRHPPASRQSPADLLRSDARARFVRDGAVHRSPQAGESRYRENASKMRNRKDLTRIRL